MKWNIILNVFLFAGPRKGNLRDTLSIDGIEPYIKSESSLNAEQLQVQI